MSASGTPGGYRRPSPSIGERRHNQFHYHQHTAPREWTTLHHQPFSVQPEERITQATRHLHTSSEAATTAQNGHHLQFRRSNLEELPIDQLFEIIDHDHYYFDQRGVGMGHNGVDVAGYRNGGPGTSGVAVEPLETRLLKPGEHRRVNRNAPIRRARQRIRNYCAML